MFLEKKGKYVKNLPFVGTGRAPSAKKRTYGHGPYGPTDTVPSVSYSCLQEHKRVLVAHSHKKQRLVQGYWLHTITQIFC